MASEDRDNPEGPGPEGETGAVPSPSSTTDSVGSSAVGEDPEPCPERIGPYKILGLLGEGGMGVVYLAEQREPIRRRVALKVIKLGMDTKEVIARFEAERQALAVLNHPNVAKVYDAGATEDGRPYFAMEHVEGVAVTEYCDRHKLNISERLKLFVQICHGVEHAHHRGVIHRDVKPSNVLVGVPDGVPVAKIIDFGVARATNQRLTEKTIYTELGRAVGTPTYMSPEQAEMTGEAVDHRTDIYSLGVVLYELLVGELPLDWESLSKVAFDEILRRVREEDPPTPSTRWSRLNLERTSTLAAKRHTNPSALRHEFRGDLDWICMKALEKERDRRYKTTAHFVDDIERYLKKEPVEARPPSAVYRVRKYVRRNRTPVAAITVVFLALATGLVVSLFFYSVAIENEENARKQAEENARLAAMARTQAEENARLAAVAQARAEENARLAAIAEARAEENLVLADRQQLLDYENEIPDLWPASPEKIDATTTWLQKAREFASRLGKHQASLGELDTSDERYEMLHMLVNGLIRFSDPDPETGALAAVKKRLELAPTKEEFTRQWQEAIASIGTDPNYQGLKMDTVDGLYPVGRDPESELWEFVHLRTGGVPQRGADGKLVLTGKTGLILVLIPGGKFLMGSEQPSTSKPEGAPNVDPEADEAEGPIHEVTLSAFFIGKYEVRQCEWSRVMKEDPSAFRGQNLPVESVSWDDARACCEKLGLRLPSEAQWEYACRAGATGRFGGTGDLDDMGWHIGNSGGRTHPVGLKRPNRFGLHDMHGNVFEWCEDVYDERFYSKPAATKLDPVSTGGGGSRDLDRVYRGGGWGYYDWNCRSTLRSWFLPGDRDNDIGVRAAASLWINSRAVR